MDLMLALLYSCNLGHSLYSTATSNMIKQLTYNMPAKIPM
jgi:hypothetical protein